MDTLMQMMLVTKINVPDTATL